MNTLLLDQADHLQQAVTSFHSSPGYLAASGVLCLRLTAAIVSIGGFWLDVKAFEKEVRLLPDTGEIDPEDRLTDRLLTTQKTLNEHYHALFTGPWRKLPWYHRMGVGLLLRLLHKVHGTLGNLRVYILERDADAADLASAGSFKSPESLIKHLKGL